MASTETTGPATAEQDAEAAIRKTLAAYNAALNGGKTAAVLPLYTQDGVFMAPFSDSNIGLDAVSTAYDRVFEELSFDVTFEIDEVVVLSSTHGFVRTHSSGHTAHASTGKKTSEANQELFILRKDEGRDWRIARYSFSPINPPTVG